MDITRAVAVLLDADVKEETIERLLCRYWDLRPSETHRFIRDGERERKIQWGNAEMAENKAFGGFGFFIFWLFVPVFCCGSSSVF